MNTKEEVFLEYFLIRVSAFGNIAEKHQEEWVKYLKYDEIDDDTAASCYKKLHPLSCNGSEGEGIGSANSLSIQ